MQQSCIMFECCHGAAMAKNKLGLQQYRGYFQISIVIRETRPPRRPDPPGNSTSRNVGFDVFSIGKSPSRKYRNSRGNSTRKLEHFGKLFCEGLERSSFPGNFCIWRLINVKQLTLWDVLRSVFGKFPENQASETRSFNLIICVVFQETRPG